MCGARAGGGAGRLLRSRPWMLPTVVVSVLALIGGTALAWTQGWMGVSDVGRILGGVTGSDDGGEGAGPHRFTPSDLSAGYRNGADVAWRIDTDNIQLKALSADHTVMFAQDYEKSYLYDISGAEPREVWSGDCGISAELWGNNLMCSVEGEGGVMVTSYQMVDGATGSVTPPCVDREPGAPLRRRRRWHIHECRASRQYGRDGGALRRWRSSVERGRRGRRHILQHGELRL